MKTISRSVYASLASRYWNSGWSRADNLRRYGRQASPEGVGGNWRLEIGGQVDAAELDAALAELKALLDHRCLFTDIPEFTERPSTLENVTVFLGARFLNERHTFLTVHESERLSCTVTADGLSMRFRVMNLDLTINGVPDESGLMTSREQVTQAVIESYRECTEAADLNEMEWARSLLQKLKGRVAGLESVRVDLKKGKYIVVK